uniref:Uncharacterized protein n=1 Tax=Caenorhabditis japonica TaxID=281687 RepID=A0A8R1IMJ8_CAEJA
MTYPIYRCFSVFHCHRTPVSTASGRENAEVSSIDDSGNNECFVESIVVLVDDKDTNLFAENSELLNEEFRVVMIKLLPLETIRRRTDSSGLLLDFNFFTKNEKYPFLM